MVTRSIAIVCNSAKSLKMKLIVCYLSLLALSCCSGCVSGLFRSGDAREGGKGASWARQRLSHESLPLPEVFLRSVVDGANEIDDFYNATLGRIMVPRVVGTPEHTAVREFIVNELETLGWTVERHSFLSDTPVGSKRFTNVIATLEPSATRRLVLACHYDSKLTPTGFVGMTDAAVPCAMMLHLAKRLQQPLKQKNKPGVTLQLMFIDGEEAFNSWTSTDSLYGSRQLANDLHNSKFPPGHDTTELHRIDLFVLLDLIGSADCKFSSYFRDSQRWYDRLVELEKRFNNPQFGTFRSKLFQKNTKYWAHVDDDHSPFLEKGVPILHLISTPFPSVWHEMSDDSSALHRPSIDRLNLIMRAFVAEYLHLSL